jgi:hypothetical protein
LFFFFYLLSSPCFRCLIVRILKYKQNLNRTKKKMPKGSNSKVKFSIGKTGSNESLNNNNTGNNNTNTESKTQNTIKSSSSSSSSSSAAPCTTSNATASVCIDSSQQNLTTNNNNNRYSIFLRNVKIQILARQKYTFSPV